MRNSSDTVNHDKLISILRERVNDSRTLHLIRAYLQAGVLDKGLVRSSTIGTPQGGPISVILSNIYLDKFDKELESRNLASLGTPTIVSFSLKAK
ncbi:MAG: reverse transcriptase domain-containing protein [Holdemanella porci]